MNSVPRASGCSIVSITTAKRAVVVQGSQTRYLSRPGQYEVVGKFFPDCLSKQHQHLLAGIAALLKLQKLSIGVLYVYSPNTFWKARNIDRGTTFGWNSSRGTRMPDLQVSVFMHATYNCVSI